MVQSDLVGCIDFEERVDQRLGKHSSFLLVDHDSVEDRPAGRQFPLAIGNAICRKNVGDHVGVAGGAEAAGAANRHPTLGE
jgi:hypothetical protein